MSCESSPPFPAVIPTTRKQLSTQGDRRFNARMPHDRAQPITFSWIVIYEGKEERVRDRANPYQTQPYRDIKFIVSGDFLRIADELENYSDRPLSLYTPVRRPSLIRNSGRVKGKVKKRSGTHRNKPTSVYECFIGT